MSKDDGYLHIEIEIGCEGTLPELEMHEDETGKRFANADEVMTYLKEGYGTMSQLIRDWSLDDDFNMSMHITYYPPEEKSDDPRPGPGQEALPLDDAPTPEPAAITKYTSAWW